MSWWERVDEWIKGMARKLFAAGGVCPQVGEQAKTERNPAI